MIRPYIICHMMTSIDGKVTGDFLFQNECAAATDIYYKINRETKSNGFICGRVTMEESFTGGWYPDLSLYEPPYNDINAKNDFVIDELSGFYSIAFDTHGKLGWKSSRIADPDGDPGYDGAQIIEVLSEDVDERYLGYLQEMKIPYIFAGEDSIDVELALFKLKTRFGCEILLLEGGSIINGAFERADVIDELSLIIAPVVAGKDCKPLFMNSNMANYELVKSETENENLILRYKKAEGRHCKHNT